MTCLEVRNRLSEYLDNDLQPSIRRELDQHLADCAACREEHRMLAATCRLLATYGPASCPVDFTDLAARVAPRSHRSARFSPLRHGLAPAVALVALVAALGLWQRPAPDLAPPTPTPTRLVVRDVAEVEEMHASFAVQQSLGARDGLLIYAAEWAGRP